MKKIDLEIKAKCAWVLFHDPKGLNTMDDAYLGQISKIVDQLLEMKNIRSVIFATTAKNFSVGLDLKEASQKTPEGIHQMALTATKTFGDVARLKVPSLALFQGLTVGGAIEMTAACDFRFAAEDTKIIVPGVKIGIFNPARMVFHLSKLIGHARTTDLVLTGRTVSAQDALHLGLVTEVHPNASLFAAGEKWAQMIESYDEVGVELNTELLRAAMYSDFRTYSALEDARLEKCFKRQEIIERAKSVLK